MKKKEREREGRSRRIRKGFCPANWPVFLFCFFSFSALPPLPSRCTFRSGFGGRLISFAFPFVHTGEGDEAFKAGLWELLS